VDSYEWTEADVAEAKRRAALKRIESEEASRSARAIEESFWEAKLIAKFPDLEYRTHEVYAALIAFSDGDQWCMCKGPTTSPFAGVQMLVWHKGSKGKFHKTATTYECGEIIPFVKEVRLIKGKEGAA
jgi:hypothetical protein